MILDHFVFAWRTFSVSNFVVFMWIFHQFSIAFQIEFGLRAFVALIFQRNTKKLYRKTFLVSWSTFNNFPFPLNCSICVAAANFPWNHFINSRSSDLFSAAFEKLVRSLFFFLFSILRLERHRCVLLHWNVTELLMHNSWLMSNTNVPRHKENRNVEAH